jgi:hypothetical protein
MRLRRRGDVSAERRTVSAQRQAKIAQRAASRFRAKTR